MSMLNNAAHAMSISRPSCVCDNPQQAGVSMKTLYLVLISLVWLAVRAVAQPQTPVPVGPPPLVLLGGTVIDVTGWGDSARDLANAVVVIEQGRITEVGPVGRVQIPKGARFIDCTGRFIIPGLVDGFAGMNSQAAANANLYMGVTTVVARADSERGYIDTEANPIPHLYLIDSVGTSDNWSLLAHHTEWIAKLREGTHPVELSPDDTARQLVDTAQLGTRVVLIGADVTAANTQLIITRAHELHLVAYGQFVATPYRVGIDAGVDALVHMDNYDLGVIPDELQKPLVDDPFGPSAATAFDYSERIPPTDARLRNYAQFVASHHAALLPTFSLDYVELPAHRNLWQEPAAALLNPNRMFQPTNPATGEMTYPLTGWSRHLPAAGPTLVRSRLAEKGRSDGNAAVAHQRDILLGVPTLPSRLGSRRHGHHARNLAAH